MAQISRPFQIALVAVMFLGLAWVLLLRPHGSSTESTASSTSSTPAATTPSSTASTPASGSSASSSSGTTRAAEEAKKAATSIPVVKGTAPGVEGLTRAINKAHGAVATSQRNAQQLAEKSAQASNEAPTPSSSASKSAVSSAAAGAAATSNSTSTSAAVSNTKQASSSGAGSSAHEETLRTTSAVESELKAGKTVLILFWNPLGSADRSVRGQVEAVQGGKMSKKVAVHYSLPREVGSYGSITRNIPVYQTPTLLIVATNKQVTTLTGFPDAYGIEQAILETKH